jgi:hypothetical protein
VFFLAELDILYLKTCPQFADTLIFGILTPIPKLSKLGLSEWPRPVRFLGCLGFGILII